MNCLESDHVWHECDGKCMCGFKVCSVCNDVYPPELVAEDYLKKNKRRKK